jgi:hypothetical protein
MLWQVNPTKVDMIGNVFTLGPSLFSFIFDIFLLHTLRKFFPEFSVGFGHSGIFATVMAVPETTVYEYSYFIFRKHNIGFSW